MRYQYYVKLSAHGNIDHGENPYKEIAECGEGYGYTIADCVDIAMKYINDNQLGRGNWTGGKVYEVETDKYIGEISYNGRYWDNELKDREQAFDNTQQFGRPDVIWDSPDCTTYQPCRKGENTRNVM